MPIVYIQDLLVVEGAGKHSCFCFRSKAPKPLLRMPTEKLPATASTLAGEVGVVGGGGVGGWVRLSRGKRRGKARQEEHDQNLKNNTKTERGPKWPTKWDPFRISYPRVWQQRHVFIPGTILKRLYIVNEYSTTRQQTLFSQRSKQAL